MKELLKQLIIVICGCLLAPVVRRFYRTFKKELIAGYERHTTNVINGEPDPWLDDGLADRVMNSERVQEALKNLRNLDIKPPTW